MKFIACAFVALLLIMPLASAQQMNVTTVADCVTALEKAQQQVDALKRIYFLFTLLFALLVLTIIFSTIYVLKVRQRLRRLEEIEVYEDIKKEERKERKYKGGKAYEVKKQGFFSKLFGRISEAPLKKTVIVKRPQARRKARKKTTNNFMKGLIRNGRR